MRYFAGNWVILFLLLPFAVFADTVVVTEEDGMMERGMLQLMPRFMAKAPDITARESFIMAGAADKLDDEECRNYVGISKEQHESIGNVDQIFSDRMNKLAEELCKKAAKTDDPKELDKLADRLVKELNDIADESYAKVKKSFTPGQLQKFREIHLIAGRGGMNEFILEFSQYEALDLTPEQRKKIDVIRAEYAKEFSRLADKMFDIMKQEMAAPPEDGTPEQIMESQEKIQKRQEAVEEEFKQLSTKTRAKIQAVLTKEQTARMETIFKNAPKALAKQVGLIKEDDEEWKKSWKPGDPIPEGAVPDRPRGIFPMGL